MWLERKRFPALELGPDEGIIAITTGVKADDLGDKKKEEILRNRVFDESTLRICMESVGFINIAPVDNNEAMVAPSSTLGWQLALEGLQTKAQLNAVPVVTHLANIHAVAAPLCRGAGALEHGDRARGYTASDYL